MRLIQEAFLELKAAFGNRWYALGSLVSALVAFVDAIARDIGGRVQSAVQGLPSWAIGLGLFLLLSAGFALAHAVRLRRRLTPDFSLSFEREGFGIASAIEVQQYYSQEHNQFHVNEFESTYVRITATATTEATVKGCVAYIKEVYFCQNQSEQFVKIPLAQPVALSEKPFRIYPGISKYIDFLIAYKRNDKDTMSVVYNWPNSIRDRIGPIGFYRFVIRVVSKTRSIEKIIEVHWPGTRASIDAHEVSSRT